MKEVQILGKIRFFIIEMSTQKKIEKMRLSKSQQFLFSRDNSRRQGVSDCPFHYGRNDVGDSVMLMTSWRWKFKDVDDRIFLLMTFFNGESVNNS